VIKVLKSGFYSTIQDFGRIGFQEYGIPYAGVMDKKAAILANSLLGNSEDEAVMEMTMTGAKLQFKTYTCIVISGANMSPKLNAMAVKNNKVIRVKPNDVLSFDKLVSGFRCYLAILGGFKTEIVMNSKSMYQGITKQSRVFENDNLQINKTSKISSNQNASVRVNSSYIESHYIEVFKGPEFECLSKSQQSKLLSEPFTISNNNNRMAYQLKEPLKNSLDAIITSSVLPGTVQLTPSGKLIILMRDCQTTGGYPRVLQLKESSIDILAQKLTNQFILFKCLKNSN